ncbi:hypothetical protein DLH72_01010 [Candidatus Gracilibacteria bacterium]|nr:MAG: hypothetical protein DLH72_01010 [Candidatus Gracilibacteria bacterium]
MQNKNLNPIIDLRSSYFIEELEKTGKYKVKKRKNYGFDFNLIKKSIVIAGFILFFLTIYLNYFYIGKVDAKKNLTIQEKIRISRLQACKKYAKIEKIYGQDAVTRCATFATIVFAFESNFGRSNMCLKKKNCYGMKGNGVEYPAGFITFKNYEKGDEYFAKKYFQFHYKKKFESFIKGKCQNGKCSGGWSATDQEIYVDFFKKNYIKIYEEILDLKRKI